jgi:hypothetical protein
LGIAFGSPMALQSTGDLQMKISDSGFSREKASMRRPLRSGVLSSCLAAGALLAACGGDFGGNSGNGVAVTHADGGKTGAGATSEFPVMTPFVPAPPPADFTYSLAGLASAMAWVSGLIVIADSGIVIVPTDASLQGQASN